jgi:chromate transporter
MSIKRQFLKDVFFLGTSAFGGPQSHLALFQKRLTGEKKYLSDRDLTEINAFCQVLPGPSSTQTLTVIGFKLGGPKLAFLTLLFWALPGALILSILTLSPRFLGKSELQYLSPLVLAYLSSGAIVMLRQVRFGFVYWSILLLAGIVVLLVNAPWLFPLGIVVGGFLSALFGNRSFVPNQREFGSIRWANFTLYLAIFLLIGILGQVAHLLPGMQGFKHPITLFENTFRMGSLVFGGGNTLTPMVLEQYVHHKPRMTADEFQTGLGLLQAMPGPVFNFAVYFNGIAMKTLGYSFWGQLLGCVLGFIAIFLPGILFVFFVYPIWDRLKSYPIVDRALDGIIAVSVGFVLAALLEMFLITMKMKSSVVFDPLWWVVLLGGFAYIQYSKWPTPILVLAIIALGFLTG